MVGTTFSLATTAGGAEGDASEEADMDRRTTSYAADKAKILTRLRRMEGQVRGVQRMVDQDQYCVDVLTQLSAIIDEASFRVRFAGQTARVDERRAAWRQMLAHHGIAPVFIDLSKPDLPAAEAALNTPAPRT